MQNFFQAGQKGRFAAGVEWDEELEWVISLSAD